MTGGLLSGVRAIRGLPAFRPRGALILGYHSISDRGDSPYTVPPELFEAQLIAMKERYRPASLEDALAEGPARRFSGGLRASVTLDDGRMDHLETALPLLEKHGVPAVFFVNADIADKGYRSFLGWRELRALAARPLAEIGSHGASHIPLAGLHREDLDREVRGSKLRIEEEIGRPVRYFAYPFGIRDRETVACARAAGYEAAFIAEPRGPGGPFEIGRRIVLAKDGEAPA